MRATPVETSVMETCAFGMNPPEESFTVPVSVAPATCAYDLTQSPRN